MLCVNRCLWRRAWTKPSSTSAESWSTRPTTSTSPNPKLPAWRKDGPDTTECRRGLFSKTLMRTFLEAAEDEPRAPLWRCSVEQSSVGLVFLFVFLFNSFVFLKKRHFVFLQTVSWRKNNSVALSWSCSCCLVCASSPELALLLADEPESEKVCPCGGSRIPARLFFLFFFVNLCFFCYLNHRLDERYRSYYTSVRVCLISVMVCPPQRRVTWLPVCPTVPFVLSVAINTRQ